MTTEEGLSEREKKERDSLLERQANHTRPFLQHEWVRLKYLSKKLFENAGDPHQNQGGETMMTNWTYEFTSHALADTGDNESVLSFTNTKDVWQCSGDEMDEKDAKDFCRLLNLMPDLWSHKLDATEFELSVTRKELLALQSEADKREREAFEAGIECIREKEYLQSKIDEWFNLYQQSKTKEG